MEDIKTPIGQAPIIPVLVMSTGAYLCWFGVHYWRSAVQWPTDPIKAILTGKPMPDNTKPADGERGELLGKIQASSGAAAGAPVGYPGQSAGPVLGGNGQPIVNDAMQYIGTGYVFGGKADKPGNWDCSSFASYVIGHDLRFPLPGGKWGDPGFPPNSHGPTTITYMLYGKPVTTPLPGDLVISGEHMGIVIDGEHYVSARTPALGVGIGKLSDPFPGGTPVFRRIV